MDGRVQVLFCNPDIFMPRKPHNSKAFKWTVPENVTYLKNFTTGDQQALLVEGDPRKSGMYFCTVQMSSGEQTTYGQEVLFVKPNWVASNMTFSFPNKNCEDQEKNKDSLFRLERQMKMIWNHPYSFELPDSISASGVKLEQNCDMHSGIYTVNVTLDTTLNGLLSLLFPQCKSQYCLIESLAPALKKKILVYTEYVRPYFKENDNIFSDSTAKETLITPSDTACADGFESGEGDLICVPCTPGTYTGRTTNGQKVCEKCQSGFCQDKYGQSSCEPCDVKEVHKTCRLLDDYHYSGNCTQTTITVNENLDRSRLPRFFIGDNQHYN